ncbi:hypothetical protein [Streptomyces djakartensis]|uniref:hypothetical protein n=1 Tax=Streptomyces djakartensis TaxID=68193 RepID=UPI0034DEA965
MQSLPQPCPATLVPDVTGIDAYQAAYRAARLQGAVFVAIERDTSRWTVKTDTLTAHPRPTLDDRTHRTVHRAVTQLIDSREIRSDSFAGPIYLVLYGITTELRARQLAAALHAALHGHLQPLQHCITA